MFPTKSPMIPASHHPLVESCLSLPRVMKRSIALFVDVMLCAVSVWLAFYLRLGEWGDLFVLGWNPLAALGLSIVISTPIFILSGLYRTIFRYSGLPVLLILIKAISIYGAIYAIVVTGFGIDGVPRTIGLIQPSIVICHSRLSNFCGILVGRRLQT